MSGPVRVVLATRNLGKVAELRRILAESPGPVGLEVVGLDQAPRYEPGPETGATYPYTKVAEDLSVTVPLSSLTTTSAGWTNFPARLVGGYAAPYLLVRHLIAGRWLAPWLAARDEEAVADHLPHSGGLPVQTDLHHDVVASS